MKVLNLGSLNIDRVYQVDQFVQPKETVQARHYEEFCGGKGLNQSIALAKAGADVYHAGAVGTDGGALLSALQEANVKTELISCLTNCVSGHAVIQLDKTGQNSIIICGGANHEIDKGYIDAVLDRFEEGDLLLLQNEISNIDYAIEAAKKKGLKTALNPSPFNEALMSCRLDQIDYFLVNEIEGKALAGCESEQADDILDALAKRFPKAVVVLTFGEHGSYFSDGRERFRQGIYKVKAVDTTAAGDTFCGYFIAGMMRGESARESMQAASAASAVAVSRMGASPSIPDKQEVETFLKESV